jgi:putative membrane protein
MSYTADPRVLFAAERTLLAWQRSAITLMGFGFVVERAGLFLQITTHRAGIGGQRAFSLGVGVVLLLLGAVVALVSAHQFRLFTRNLEPAVIPPRYSIRFGIYLNGLIAAIGTALAVHFIWQP